jgi:FkbM family methyltransferase
MQPQLKIKNTPYKPTIDTIVHLGAGRCSELDDYLAQQPRRLLLVEADPQLAEDLQNRTKDLESVQVSCAAIAGRPGPATFNRYNLPEFNSLHAASKLIELFPGLKTVEQLKVNAISPDSLLSLLKLNVEQKNLLIIDLPGEELPVLQVLKQSQKLHLFCQMILHCGCQSLYEESEPAALILAWLRDEGFDLVAKDCSIDPDRPSWTLLRNVVQLRNSELQNQVEQSTKKIEEWAIQAADLQDRVEALTRELDVQKKQAKEREIQIGQLKKACEQQAGLVTDREQRIAELRKDRDKQADLAADRQSKISKLVQSRDEQSKQASERKLQIDIQAKAHDEHAILAANLNNQLKQLYKTITEINKSEVDLKNKIQIAVEECAEQDKIKVLLLEAKNKVVQLGAQFQHMETRQLLINEELLKTESQIDLIKDFLLADSIL